jgi:fatty-acyl-CoA synthase
MVLDVTGSLEAEGEAGMLAPTPTDDNLPRRLADFETLGEALDYASQGKRGLNFHDARGNLVRPYPFAELREDSLKQAQRLIAAGVQPNDRIALIAETGIEFASLFFGASMPAPGRCRCRCRPASAARSRISTSSASSSQSCDPTRC